MQTLNVWFLVIIFIKLSTIGKQTFPVATACVYNGLLPSSCCTVLVINRRYRWL